MIRTSPLRLTILLSVALVMAALPSFASEPPNVVVILADDLGWNAVGYHNHEFVTPNIDRLVADGVELDRFYVAPMCSPTRAGLMTGRYPIRFGCARAVIPPQRDFGLPIDETTLGEALNKTGYQHRGVFGKWHLGHRRAKWHPVLQGFSHFHGHYNGAIDYFELTRESERDWHVNFDPSPEQGYSTDLIAGAAADWIKSSAQQSAPYFCYAAFNAPHSPFQAPDEALSKFDHFRDQASTQTKKKRANSREAPIRQTYAAMIWKMDLGIGRILEAIEASGESDNTIVWFFSDNGGVGNIDANNHPLRGSKLTVYEGGIRVPAAVRWPAQIPPGRVCKSVCGYIDILPTLIAAAGERPDQVCDKPLDGMDVMPLLTCIDAHEVNEMVAARPWYSYHGQSGEDSEHLAVTVDGWKLKVNGPRLKHLRQLDDGSNDVELFHLSQDLLETNNLTEQFPEKVQQLGKLLVLHRALQPEDSVPPYGVGSDGFVPPANWKLDASFPEQLVGSHK